MLVYILYGLFFISCLVLVGTVLLQPGKADAGALFTSSISSTAFGARGTQTILSKITIGAAAIFFLAALLLSFPAITGNISVLQTTSEGTSENKPVVDSNTNTTKDNTSVNANNTNAGADNEKVNGNTSVNANTTANTNK
jgi:preprotein translocase subunit SecG